MFVHSNEKKLLIFMFMFICWLKKKYEELELTKLEFHITRNPSLVSSSTIEEKKRPLRSSFVFTKNSSLVSSSIVLHGTRVYQAQVPCGIFSIKKSTSTQVFFFIYLYILFYETRVFKTRFTQKTWVLWTRVSKKWYIASYFVKNGMLLIISAKSGKWPIWPSYRNKSLKPKYDLF